MNSDKITARFSEIFGAGAPPRLFFAPGRVNLIGEHTDYNGGHVLPCALELGTYAAVRVREDRLIRVASCSRHGAGIREYAIEEAGTLEETRGWKSFSGAVIRAFADEGYFLPAGLDILYKMTLPTGAGLASLTTISVVTALLLRDLFWDPVLDNLELVRIVMRCANEYLGYRCSIMDPFVQLMAVKNHATFITVPTLRYEEIPLCFEEKKIILANSMVRMPEAGREFGKRHEECEKALKKIQTVTYAKSLGSLDVDRFESCKDVIMNDTYTKRARHAVYENVRSIRAVSALRVHNIARFGELMNQSHISLRDEYEVSCPELDFLAETAWTLPGVIGSRMTGGGFGGCTVNIVEEAQAEAFQETLGAAYRKRFSIDPEFYIVETDDGAREII